MKQAEAERKRNQLRMMLTPLIKGSGVAVHDMDGEQVGYLEGVEVGECSCCDDRFIVLMMRPLDNDSADDTAEPASPEATH